MYQRTIALEGFLQSAYIRIIKPLAGVAKLISVRSFQNDYLSTGFLYSKNCTAIYHGEG